jgi:hypothetical protein
VHKWWNTQVFQGSCVISTLEQARGTLGNIVSMFLKYKCSFTHMYLHYVGIQYDILH